MKIKCFFLFLFISCFSFGVFAQVAADPLDFFYTDLTIWETSGLINNLPAARPYPLQMVKVILNTIIENGDSTQRAIAESHYKRFFSRIITFGGKSEAGIDTANAYKQLGIAMSMDLNYEIEDYLTASASVDGWAINKLPSFELLPTWQKSSRDIVGDNAKVGPFWILPSMNSSIGVGNTEYYLNAGLMRGSFGPFPENGVIVGSQALHSGQYSFAVSKPKWGFNLSLYSLSANNGLGSSYTYNTQTKLLEETSSDYQAILYPSKYLSVHSFDYRPFDWLSISFLESVMYGGRLDLMYLLPFSPYIISQGITGFNDNSYLGGMFTVKPIEGLKIDGVLYADDLSFNDIIRFNFDTKWRLAGQIGASFAPRSSGIFTLAALDYTMVTPYQYAHKEGEDLDLTKPNFQNYIHAGHSFGAALDPNSDRINLKIKVRPLEGMEFDLIGILIRHGNVNEGMDPIRIKEYITGNPGQYITDGTMLNSSGTNANHAFFYSTPFLTQDTIQYIWQSGFDALCRLPVLKTGGYMVFRFAYRFECNMNDGINSQVYTYNKDIVATDDTSVTKEAAKQLSAWREKATGVDFNNYISAGFEYYF